MGCTEDYECDDGDECTDSTCQDGQCRSYPNEKCLAPECSDDSECDDADHCTQDVCESGRCQHYPFPGCGGDEAPECQENNECDDGRDCTDDVCNYGKCEHLDNGSCEGSTNEDYSGEGDYYYSSEVVASTCTDDSECDDSNECTYDVCEEGACSHYAIDDCEPSSQQGEVQGEESASTALTCSDSSECDDNDTCTSDECEEGSCMHYGIEGCVSSATESAFESGELPTCTDASECEDDNDCTMDVCEDGYCINYAIDGCEGSAMSSEGLPEGAEEAAQLCEADADCEDNNACTTDSCEEGVCTHYAVDCQSEDRYFVALT